MTEARQGLPGCGGRKLTGKGEEGTFRADGNILIFIVNALAASHTILSWVVTRATEFFVLFNFKLSLKTRSTCGCQKIWNYRCGSDHVATGHSRPISFFGWWLPECVRLSKLVELSTQGLCIEFCVNHSSVKKWHHMTPTRLIYGIRNQAGGKPVAGGKWDFWGADTFFFSGWMLIIPWAQFVTIHWTSCLKTENIFLSYTLLFLCF